MKKLMTFTHSKSLAVVHLHPETFSGFMPLYKPGAKPEDNSDGCLIFILGVADSLHVKENYGEVVHILREHGLEV